MPITIDQVLGKALLHTHQESDISDLSHFTVTVGTKQEILATSPDSAQIAFATDTKRFYLYDGSNWYESGLQFVLEQQAPAIGYYQDHPNQGYGDDYITDKRLSHVLIGSNDREENGAIRVNLSEDPDTFEMYLRGVWQSIHYDLTTEYGDFRHTPLSKPIYIWRGDSVQVGLDGRPVIQEYQGSMGAYQPPSVLDGGTF